MNIIEAIQAECDRVRELMPSYEDCGPSGAFGLAVLKASIDNGNAAIASGDVGRMVAALLCLRDCE